MGMTGHWPVLKFPSFAPLQQEKSIFFKIKNPFLDLSLKRLCVNNPEWGWASWLSSVTVWWVPPQPPPHIRHRSVRWQRPSSACRNGWRDGGGGPSCWDSCECPTLEEGVRFCWSGRAVLRGSLSPVLRSSQTPSLLCLWRRVSCGPPPSPWRRRSRSGRCGRRRGRCSGRRRWSPLHPWSSASACGAGPTEPPTHPGVWIRPALPGGMRAGWHWAPSQRLSETTAKTGCWVSWVVCCGDDETSVTCYRKKKTK